MNVWAAIIAIEDYPNVAGELARKLPGTNEAGKMFRDWVMTVKNAPAANVIACAGVECNWRTKGTSRQEIKEAFDALVIGARDKADEVYVLFSGHGIGFSDDPNAPVVDILIGSDFGEPSTSGGACLRFSEVREKLRVALGPGKHFYFIDACRNAMTKNDIDPNTSLGSVWGRSNRGNATSYVLFSTAPGDVAKVDPRFNTAVLKGLKGSGRAKAWVGGRMHVTFESLCSYVQQMLQNDDLEPEKKGPLAADSRIVELIPTPTSSCEVEIIGAEPSDQFTLNAADLRNSQRTPVSFVGANKSIALSPEDYYFKLTTVAGVDVPQIDPPPAPSGVDLYEDRKVRFQMGLPASAISPAPQVSGAPGNPPSAPPEGGSGEPARGGGDRGGGDGHGGDRGGTAAAEGSVTISGVPSTDLVIQDIASGLTRSIRLGSSEETIRLRPGRYKAKLQDGNFKLGSSRLEILPGATLNVDLAPKAVRGAKLSLSKALPVHEFLIDFSESLSDVPDWNLSLWLAVLGGSRIVAAADTFSKLQSIDLEKFNEATANKSILYVLAGELENAVPACDVGANPRRKLMRPVPQAAGLFEARIEFDPGPLLITYALDERHTTTILTHGLPNRATLMTFARDERYGWQIQQFILPIHSLQDRLSERELSYLRDRSNPPLPRIRYMSTAQRLFEQQARIEANTHVVDDHYWRDLLEGKWLDPLMALIACYELIRRGTAQAERGLMHTVLQNMRIYFPGFADTEVIAMLLDEEYRPITAAPLLMDGVMATPGRDILPLPETKLDFNGIWTSWRNAVAVVDLAQPHFHHAVSEEPCMRRRSECDTHTEAAPLGQHASRRCVVSLLELAPKQPPSPAWFDIQQTTFSHDVLGRYTCNTWDEVDQQRAAGGYPFDVIVIGAGMFGAYCTEKLYRHGRKQAARILLLDAGAFLLPTHIQNLPHRLGGAIGGPDMSTTRDAGFRNLIWRVPWISNEPFPGLAYCIGGRSLFWGGWSPRLTANDLANWPTPVAAYLIGSSSQPGAYNSVEREIGVDPSTDYIVQASLYGMVKNAFDAVKSSVPGITDVAEAPLAVQGASPGPGIFPFDKFSSNPFLIDAIRDDVSNNTMSGDLSRRVFLVPNARVLRLNRSGNRVVSLVADIAGQQQVIPVASGGAVVIANGTIEATRLALDSLGVGDAQYGSPRVGNLMAHLRSNITVRIKRSVFGLTGPATDLETVAYIVRGETLARRFHHQVIASSVVGPNPEAAMWSMVPDIELFGNMLANQNPDWITFVFRGIGEMEDKRTLTPDPAMSWIDLSPETDYGVRRAYVNLVVTQNDRNLWTAMDKTAFDLAEKIAQGPGNIQYLYPSNTPQPNWQPTRPQPDAQGRGFWQDLVGSTHHEAGTLYMGDPGSSITDYDGKFHGLDNVYVAGPAIFPTLGSANPSLTGMALVRKTADAILKAGAGTAAESGFTPLSLSAADWMLVKQDPSAAGGFRNFGSVLESFGSYGLYWYTREPFANFVLRLDWRVARRDDNSGVFIRTPGPSAVDPLNTAVAQGHEIQIDERGFDSPSGTEGHPLKQTGAIYDLQAPSALPSGPAGEWNSYEIEANGNKIRVTLNGQLVNDYTSNRQTSGFIALQAYRPGSRVQFRNLRVKKLP